MGLWVEPIGGSSWGAVVPTSEKTGNATHLNINIKLRLFRSNVLYMLLYASSTWKVTALVARKLQAFINSRLHYQQGILTWDSGYDIHVRIDQKLEVGADRSHIEKGRQLHCEFCHAIGPTISRRLASEFPYLRRSGSLLSWINCDGT